MPYLGGEGEMMAKDHTFSPFLFGTLPLMYRTHLYKYDIYAAFAHKYHTPSVYVISA